MWVACIKLLQVFYVFSVHICSTKGNTALGRSCCLENVCYIRGMKISVDTSVGLWRHKWIRTQNDFNFDVIFVGKKIGTLYFGKLRNISPLGTISLFFLDIRTNSIRTWYCIIHDVIEFWPITFRRPWHSTCQGRRERCLSLFYFYFYSFFTFLFWAVRSKRREKRLASTIQFLEER